MALQHYQPLTLLEKDACGVGFIYHPHAQHDVLSMTMEALARVEHRGACGADGISGDGAGVLTSIPWKILENEGYPGQRRCAVGVVFLPPENAPACRADAETLIQSHGFEIIAWRPVPIDVGVLGPLAQDTCPQLFHLILAIPQDAHESDIEQQLMVARKHVITTLRARPEYNDFYIASLSVRTIVYKAMVQSGTLPRFYKDLTNQLFETRWTVFHRRFSTNTMPRWDLAQPFRLLAHNGEINTLLGNRNWMRAREPLLDHPVWNKLKAEGHAVIYARGSDSANLDNALELLTRLGHSAGAALMQLVPEAYRQQPELQKYPQIVDFYEYYAGLQEPWDGPALIAYCDGKTVGAALDRNGLRPARYTIYRDGLIVLASEVGLVDRGADTIAEMGRLGPGQMISVDVESGAVGKNWEIKQAVAALHPYGEWVKKQRLELPPQPFDRSSLLSNADLLKAQLASGYGTEDIEHIILPMTTSAEEPVLSMGDDTPLAVLSQKPRVLFDYFKQRFAQVTNPPIDYLRERLVMSLDTYLGARTSYLSPTEQGARSIRLSGPVISENELERITSLGGAFASVRLPMLFDPQQADLSAALDELCDRAAQAANNNQTILILSDRGISQRRAAIPSLLAVGAVHQHLIRQGIRLNTSIIVETGQCWSSHHYACLLGYGAQAVCPYLAFETIRHKTDDKQALDNYREAVHSGLRKILSKMGICLLSSYIGSQTFECLGLGASVMDRCFPDTVSRLGGIDLPEIAQQQLRFHVLAYPDAVDLVNYGMMKFRPDGEYHGNNPALVRALHGAIGLKSGIASAEQRQEQFVQYSSMIRNRQPVHIRDLLAFHSDRQPISVDEVEPASAIVRRFLTGGMSLGALSKESHEALAIAMNRLGGKSNSGEGGEDPLRYYPIVDIGPDGTSPHFPGLTGLREGDRANSAVRQVASARFGVTPEYLATSEQLEIKIAQGAKPGEGGQLPASKVSQYIASLRLAKPGVPLISPPPHHDIYSIEDLAQLIFDLKQVNPRARISVKLVAQVGIGTVAAGVAKANADIVQISGHDGGTGASPISSIKHAGTPWELGLVEAHQSLLANRLRDKVLLRVDGGLKSGWDVVIAALLGADEYGFGSIALVAQGCVMARICHTNLCPVGITSQKESLRKRFSGNPQSLVEFFLYVAEEVRHTLAELGYRSLGEIIGRNDLLDVKSESSRQVLSALDLTFLTAAAAPSRDWIYNYDSPHGNPASFDDTILSDEDIEKAIQQHGEVHKAYVLTNRDRSVGAKLSGVLAKQYGDGKFKGHIKLDLVGFAGQSFGAFNAKNVSLILTGAANDYVGKGMNGGEIVIRPPESLHAVDNLVLVGNTCLYGATGGKLFVAGQAGERFAVRNSAAVAVVEGAGDHCCEYMTGGTVVVIGTTGRNFGAGMTGGIAYVLDERDEFASLCNLDQGKKLERVSGSSSDQLKSLIEEHFAKTGSRLAATVLDNFPALLPRFWRVVPPPVPTASSIVEVPVPAEQRGVPA